VRGKVLPKSPPERTREEIAERRGQIRDNEAVIRKQEAAGMDYPGEYAYKGIEYLKQEIRELISWL
jgi:hypothetical protein